MYIMTKKKLKNFRLICVDMPSNPGWKKVKRRFKNVFLNGYGCAEISGILNVITT